MTWTTFHHRGEVLRTIIRTADARRDGVLPMDVAGVRETFGDELTLLGALQLRWHTRLSGHLERAMLDHPADLEQAVIDGWHSTAHELPGTRLVLDRYRAEPLDEEMVSALAISAAKERVLMAAMAGRAGARTEDSVTTGFELEQRARETHRPAPAPPTPSSSPGPRGLLGRIKAHVAA